MKQSDMLDMDAVSTVRVIQEGKVSIEEIVDVYIKHIKRFNPYLNAMVENRFAEARDEAVKRDNAKGIEKGPLYGVPVSVKEAYNVKGMKTTGGLIRFKDLIARRDAEVVTKLKNAGAIILGKTNTPELCFYQETDNQLYGRTNNPWNVSRTAGGSSGGEGALLVVGGASVGIGSDIGGSIRFPSHFNGVVGFKPGKYHVSGEGHFPANAIPMQERILGMGPMGKSVRDMNLMYNIMAHEPALSRHLNNFHMVMLPESTPFPLSNKTRQTINKVENILINTLSVQRETPPYFSESALLWQEMMSVDGGESVKKVAMANDRTNMLTQFLIGKVTGEAQIHPNLAWALTGAQLFKPSVKRKQEMTEILEVGDNQLLGYLKQRILVLPVYHQGALEHGEVYREIFSIRKTFLKYMPYTAYANVWGLPSLIVPVGIDAHQMPISVQLVSNNGNEDALFQLGEILEKALGGYIRNKGWDEKFV